MFVLFATAPYFANGYLDPQQKGLPPSDPQLESGGVGASYSISYTYDGGVLSRITYPSSLTVAYTHDGLGRISEVSKLGTSTFYAGFTYNKNDQIETVTYGNDLVGTYGYDALSRPSTMMLQTDDAQQTTHLSLVYGYTENGAVASINGQIDTSTIDEDYLNDPLGRLTNSTLVNGGTTTGLWYEYDGFGNCLRQGVRQGTSGPWTATKYNYKTGINQLKDSTGSVVASYSYDPNGQLLSRNVRGGSSWAYTWDTSGRLVKVGNSAGAQGVYAYDGLGRRVESVEGASAIFYAYLGTETLHEQSSSGAMTDFVYAAGLRTAKVTGNTVSYYHTDHLGSTRLVTDSVGQVDVNFANSYRPFGQDTGTTGSETYKFTGKPYSSSTGLYYSFQRWYDPEIGRFISQDLVPGSLSRPQTLNRYTYVANSPTNYIDPTGMALETIFDIGSVGYDIWELWNNPSWENALWLTLDVGALLIPFVPSVAGPLARAGKTVARFAPDIASHADEAAQGLRTVFRGSDAGPDALRLATDIDAAARAGELGKLRGLVFNADIALRFGPENVLGIRKSLTAGGRVIGDTDVLLRTGKHIEAMTGRVDTLEKIGRNMKTFANAGVPKSSTEFWFSSHPWTNVIKFLRENRVGYKIWYGVL